MKRKYSITSITILLLNIGLFLYGQKTISLESLIKEMVDRSELARFPSPSFTCKQRSSTDKRTISKDKPNWFGNQDCTNFIRVDSSIIGKEYVLLDEKGPGAIVRFWSTFAGTDSGEGILRFYFDGSKTPSIVGNARQILSRDQLVGKPLAVGLSVLSNPKQWGLDFYLPLPYQSGCKITYQSDKVSLDDPNGLLPGHESVFYNINFRSYERGTKVISYSANELKKNHRLITHTLQLLSSGNKIVEQKKLNISVSDMTIAPDSSKTIVIKGSRAIKYFTVMLNAEHTEQALRSTVLEIKFDGIRTIWTPIGDFFGIGYKQLYSRTWYASTYTDGRMEAFWVMPFKEKCEIIFHNYGNENVIIKKSNVMFDNWKWDTLSMYFGVSWHQYTKISTGRDKYLDWEKVGAPFDINFVTLTGKGVYVGDAICLFHGDNSWWGEGDEKIYVDGEIFPSHLGTGTEDYYGYAWGRPETIEEHPFISVPGGSNSWAPTMVVNSRLRSLDKITFNNSLVFDMELWHHFSTFINYAPTTYWYIKPGGRSEIVNDIVGVKHKVALKREDLISQKMTLAVEAENMAVLNEGNGLVLYNHYGVEYRDIWSNSSQLFWQNAHKGDKLELSFESVYSDIYNLNLLCTTKNDYGKINIYINGRLAAKNVDLNSIKIQVIPIELGRFAITEGINNITIELVDLGAGCSVGNIGIDKLVFTK